MTEDDEIFFEEDAIPSEDAKVPLFLKATYLFFPVWGILWFILYWNGSTGILDPKHWNELQTAANTKIPFENANMPKDPEWDAFEGEKVDLLQYD